MAYAGVRWQRETQARPLAHAYIRNGTAKLMTLFCPATGAVRVRGTRRCTNVVLHHWLHEACLAILAALPAGENTRAPRETRSKGGRGREGSRGGPRSRANCPACAYS